MQHQNDIVSHDIKIVSQIAMRYRLLATLLFTLLMAIFVCCIIAESRETFVVLLFSPSPFQMFLFSFFLTVTTLSRTRFLWFCFCSMAISVVKMLSFSGSTVISSCQSTIPYFQTLPLRNCFLAWLGMLQLLQSNRIKLLKSSPLKPTDEWTRHHGQSHCDLFQP